MKPKTQLKLANVCVGIAFSSFIFSITMLFLAPRPLWLALIILNLVNMVLHRAVIDNLEENPS